MNHSIFNVADLMLLAPVWIIALTAVIVMLLIAVKRHHHLIATVSVIGLNLAAVTLIVHLVSTTFNPVDLMGLFVIDRFSLLYQLLILVAALACCTLSHAYIEGYQNRREELYLMMLLSVMGALLMVNSTHYASFFISLELMSVPVYGLVAYTHERENSLEAGIKYLVLSATASAMLLMGMAYIYAYTGSLSFYLGFDALLGMLKAGNPMVILGIGLILFAVAFKLSLAPFHKWTPDVYQGAPAPLATFLATVAKVATFGLLIRYVLGAGVLIPSILTILSIIAVLSIVLGNLLAVKQNNLKRLLAYSSIAHFGYVLTALVSKNYLSLDSLNVYMVTYILTTIGAFGVVTLMSSPYSEKDAEQLVTYTGLFWRRPLLTATLTVMMLSLAGIPLTAGFIGKFMLIKANVEAGHWVFAAMIIVGSGIGLYYYLRVIMTLYMTPTTESIHMDAEVNWGQKAGGIMVLLSALLVLLIGIYPDPLIQWAASSQLTAPIQVLLFQQ
ncbi:NADH-quinone oxidoreductase subunit NuoN [Acinetobacter apis]|uniref:NADH-quinone oxidoreductase subunit N n=1 Tax=Acinetobacter apis TaxID=1229165 RepID=A0A217EFG3_9GAMM|nr:NADH-quinone oxidoreductase subunit NuoN [Acinetobacter apis]SNQ29239.1 NADH dehydrogenase subunit N [Acinetobacter apis]